MNNSSTSPLLEKTSEIESVGKKDFNAEEELRIQKLRNQQLKEQVEELKASLVHQTRAAEFGDENRSLRLLRRIRSLSIEREELQQTLTTKEDKVEKLQENLRESERASVSLQHKMEVEQEYISNQLQKKIAEQNAKRRDLERRLAEVDLSEGLKGILTEVLETLGRESNYPQDQDERGVLVSINAGIQGLIQRNRSLEDDNEVLRTHEESLKNRAYVLQQKIGKLQTKIRTQKFEQAQLIGEMEIADESSFNLEQKRHSISSQSSSTLSASVSVSSLDAQDSLALEKRQKAVFQMMATHSPEKKPEASPVPVNVDTKTQTREEVAFERLSLTGRSMEEEAPSPSPQRARSLSQTMPHSIKPGQLLTNLMLTTTNEERTQKSTQITRSPLPRPKSFTN